MKLFIKKIYFLFLLIIGILTLVTVVNKLILKEVDPFVLDSNVNVLILGDSHTKFAFNDKILSNTKNFSNSADSYFYSFQKLKQIVKYNSQIDTVLMSFSKHNLDKDIETRWLFNSSHLRHRLKLYFPLLNMDDMMFLFENKPMDLLSGFFNQIYFPIYVQDGEERFGGYEKNYENVLKSQIEKFKKGESFNDSVFVEADSEIKYLNKIISFCNSKKIHLILISTPLHKVLHDQEKDICGVYKKYFSDIPYLNYSSFEMGDSCFTDLVHLNTCGAASFSKKIKSEGFVSMEN